ncbi:MAG: YkgJ family cysteine cluster protein [Crocinitomicaceae bacterium]|nr:YkgJ family cysteine cluster protein [Crocinitomicaceae bacterium]
MNSDYQKYLKDPNDPALKKKFQQLRKKRKELDRLFHEEHQKVFNEMDCLECANCCKTTSPIFTLQDIARISKKFKMKEGDFISQYLRLDEENDYVLQTSPCAFLNEDNTCFIYDFRPNACREYPHTDRKNMYQILNLTRTNSGMCPAVGKIMDEILKTV